MNQEQVKEKLLQLEEPKEDFTLIFSGKKSRKVNGLYHPESKEIIIHNKNFETDNSMMYTAIHEFAHHIHHINSPVPITSRSHTNEFWSIFHKLLIKAEEIGIYENIFEVNNDFKELTNDIKNSYIFKNAQMMKDVGKLLVRAVNLCQIHHVRFEDYVNRGLLINRATADTMVKIYTMNINPEIGFDNMKIVSRIKDDTERKRIENEFLSGKTQDMIKAELSAKKPENTKEFLEKERIKIERSILRLNEKLKMIEEKINEIND